MVEEQHAHHTPIFPTVSAALMAGLIKSVQRTAQVMDEMAAARETAAAGYRLMARKPGPDSLRYLRRAEELDQSAARARRIAAQELERATEWQRTSTRGTGA